MPDTTDRPPLQLRRQGEILNKIYGIARDDLLGFRREVLTSSLAFEYALPFLVEGVTAATWAEQSLTDPAELFEAAVEYYEFALGKIQGHRGISAERSVQKLTEYAWLLCRDDVVSAMEEADYPQYGAPKVTAFAAGFGLPWPDDEDLARMAAGDPCTSDCASGCAW